MANSVVIALGANLGNREDNLQSAINHLRKICDIVAVSNVYSSKAVLKNNSPES
ncbi:MAG TPA: hypothetical protein DIV86_03505, partial [Alphaproteobacteria bacterium]|nr:hypothetical protein [Alphaproteobacteria bacterium]